MKEKRESRLNNSQVHFLENKPLNPSKWGEQVVHNRPEKIVVDLIADKGR